MNLFKMGKKRTWPWQIVVMILPLILFYLIVGANESFWKVMLSGAVIYLVFELYFDNGRFPRSRKNNRKLIQPLLFIGIELTVNLIYAYVKHIPFFRYSIPVIFKSALCVSWFEELTTTLIWVTMLISVIHCRKQQILKQNLCMVVFIASLLFGLMHMTNLPLFLEVGRDEPLFIVILLFLVHFVNAFATGLVYKSLFLKTGSLFFCILLHFLNIIIKMGTIMPNEVLVYSVVVTLVYLLYGTYELVHIDDTVVNEWNRRLRLSKMDLIG